MWNETSRRMGPPYAAFVVIIECGMLLMVPIGGMLFSERFTGSQYATAVCVCWFYVFNRNSAFTGIGHKLCKCTERDYQTKEILDIPIYEGGTDFPRKIMILNFGMSDFLMTVKPMYCMVSTSKSMMASAWLLWADLVPVKAL